MIHAESEAARAAPRERCFWQSRRAAGAAQGLQTRLVGVASASYSTLRCQVLLESPYPSCKSALGGKQGKGSPVPLLKAIPTLKNGLPQFLDVSP